MKGYLLVAAALFALIVLAPSSAACPTLQARDTTAFLREIPSLHSQLQNCSVSLPRATSFVISDGNTQVDVAMNDGTTESFAVQIRNRQVTGVLATTSVCKQRVTVSERALDSALASSDRAGAFTLLFAQNQLRLRGCSFTSSIRTFFVRGPARWFASRQAPATIPSTWGKPDNCDETFLPGHQGYAQNKQVWDSYSQNADGVCQSQYGRGIPSPCVHSVQLSVSGNPYYLCWYRN